MISTSRLIPTLALFISTPALAGDALYVWRDPLHSGTPVYAGPETDDLVTFCLSRAITTVYYDNWGDGSTDAGSGRQNDTTLTQIISTLHGAGISVEALYTDKVHVGDVAAYNTRVGPAARFDGIRMNFEGPWPGGGSEPTRNSDIRYFADAVAAAAGVPLFASISFHWDTPIRYGGSRKAAFSHIQDLVAGVDVQTAQDEATVIADISKEEVCYGDTISRPTWVTIETFDVVHELGLKEWNTYYEEGEAAMMADLSHLTYITACSGAAAVVEGRAFHFYNRSMGNGGMPGW